MLSLILIVVFSYEPELHPGVTYRLTNPKATLKIFSTGSVTVTGKWFYYRIYKLQCALVIYI